MSFPSPYVADGLGASGIQFGPPGPPIQNNNSQFGGVPPGRYSGFDPRFLNALVQNAYSSTISRGMFRRQLADERRDIPRECGYPLDITIDLYANLYEREPYAARVVQLMPKECWQVQPTVYEDETSETKTPFEEAWDRLGGMLRPERSYHRQEEGSLLWNYLLRADVLSGIGSYGVIVLGLDDGLPLERPIAERREGAQLRYLRVLPESLAPISRFVNDENDPRNGLPEMYSCTFQDTKAPISGSGVASATGTTTTREVHWTRVIHVADNLEASEWAGVPRMRTPFDPLLDIVKTRSASNEGFWRAVVSILSLETDPALGGDVDVNPAKVRQMLEQFYGGMQRDLILNGMTAKTIAPTVSDPTPHIAACVESICVLMGVPVRVFKGSERGELASSQDDDAWNDRLSMRQQTYLTPSLIVPFVDRLISVGVLPEPEGYSVAWPDVASRSPAERATTAAARATAMSTYVSGGLEALMAPHDFLTREMGYDEDEADAIVEAATEAQTEKLVEQQAQADELGMKVAPPPGMIDPEQQKMEQEATLELAKAGGKAKGPPPPGAKGTKPGFVKNAFCPTGEGGGIDNSCSPSAAQNRLDSLPDAESDLQTFEGRDGPELHLKQIGFQGIGKIFAYPSDRQLSKMGVKMSLSPDRVKYSQSSVVKGHVKTILENGSKTSETDPLLVVKEGENYYLQGGHHRAAASILQSGKFTATVIEKVGKKWTKPEEPTANALGGAKKGGSGGK